jgi:hypothetical protein
LPLVTLEKAPLSYYVPRASRFSIKELALRTLFYLRMLEQVEAQLSGSIVYISMMFLYVV